MTNKSTEKLHVLIVGAGINGLLLAQGLKKHGISFEIFEAEASATDPRHREWGMSIQWALPMLPMVLPDDLMSDLQTAAVDPFYVCPAKGTSMPIYNGETGEKIEDVPLVQFLRAHRNKMRALCTRGLDIQYGKLLQSVETSTDGSKVTATFKDGTKISGSLLVGADGANSNVRASVFPERVGKSHPIPFGGVNMHCTYGSAATATLIRQAFTPIQAVAAHPKGYWLWLSIQNVQDPAKPEDWQFQLQWTWKTNASNAALAELDLEKLKAEAAAVFGEPFRTAWLQIPAGTKVSSNKISVWQPQPVPNQAFGGTVALLGDAAHAMSFHRGQGMNHGIADGCKLTEVLAAVAEGKMSQKEAVLEYETEMIARAGEEVRISLTNTEMMHNWQLLKDSPFMQRGGDKNK